MTVTIGSTSFDNVFYDAEVDGLHLNNGDLSTATDFDESPEGHSLRFDADANIVGMTIAGAKASTDENGEIKTTLPEIVNVVSDILAPALIGA